MKMCYIGQTVRSSQRRKATVTNTYTYEGEQRTYRGEHTHATLRVGKRQINNVKISTLSAA